MLFFICFPLFPQLILLERSDPAPRERRASPLRGAHQTICSGAPPQRSLPFCTPVALAQILPEENRSFPDRVARNPRKGRAGSSLSGWPQAPSGVPGSPLSLFPRGLAQVPPQSASGFPLPEKNLKTHGVLAGQDSALQETSHGRRYKNLRIRIRGYRLRHHNSCGTWKIKSR